MIEILPDGAWQITFWKPKGVQGHVATGSDCFIGKVDDLTVLKYPQGEERDYDTIRKHYDRVLNYLHVERQIFERVGKHPRIIEFKGWQDSSPGILIEYAPNGSADYFLRDRFAELSPKARLRIAKETAQGVAFVHSRNVVVRDIATRNILLDADLHVKLCDLSGQLLGDAGEVLAEGQGWEDFDATKPRPDKRIADISTDIFALGTCIFNIVTGTVPFPDTEDNMEIKARFERREYPKLDRDLGGEVVWACWDSAYKSVDEVAENLEKLEQACPQ